MLIFVPRVQRKFDKSCFEKALEVFAVVMVVPVVRVSLKGNYLANERINFWAEFLSKALLKALTEVACITSSGSLPYHLDTLTANELKRAVTAVRSTWMPNDVTLPRLGRNLKIEAL